MVRVRTQAWKKLAFCVLRRWENEHTSARLRRIFADWFGVEVGAYSYGCFDPDRFPSGTKIGRYCSFARSATAFDTDHPASHAILHPASYHPGFGVVQEWGIQSNPLVIGDDVWLGHNVTILAGTGSIGRGAIVAAGAVVTQPIARYMVVAGVPAKSIRARFDADRIAEIEASTWWTLDLQGLRAVFSADPPWLSGTK
jgi:virginiamycin A acetyltransferase